MRTNNWYAEIHETCRRYFARNWLPNLDRLNTDFGLSGIPEQKLMTVAPGLPPAWFSGNIAGMPENEWILVVSHNPHINHLDEKTKIWYQARQFDADSWWKYWSSFNRDSPHRNRNFTRLLARVAARAIGEPEASSDYFRFAYERMVFVDICPYASNTWKLNEKRTCQLMSVGDEGIEFSGRLIEVLIETGFPRLVLVQGSVVLNEFALLMNERLNWRVTDRYSSRSSKSRSRSYWHLEGTISTRERFIPVFGFPKLGGRNGRQANADLDDLGARMERFTKEALIQR